MRLRTKNQKLAAIAGVLCAVLAVMFLAVLGALHTQTFQNWARLKIVAQLEQALGTPVEMDRFALGLAPLTADFYGIVIHGNETTQQTPLLRAEHLRVVLQWKPLLRRQVQIDQMLLEKPAISVQVAANGRNNLPAPPAANRPSGFHVAIRYAQLKDGSLIYNDLTIPLSADLYGLQAKLATSPLSAGTYHAELRYDHGRVVAQDFRPLEHTLLVRATIAPTQCSLQELKLAMLHSQIQAQGVLQDYRQPRFTGTYRASLNGEDLAFVQKNPNIPAGQATLAGSLEYTASRNGAGLVAALASAGEFSSEELLLRGSAASVPLRKLHGAYALQNGVLRLNNIEGAVLGGRLLSASDTIDLHTNSGMVQAQLRNVSLPQAGQIWGRSRRLPTIASRGNVQAEANWKDGFRNALTQVQAQFSSQGVSQKPDDIPLDGTLDASYDLRADKATIRNSKLRTGASELDASGTIARHSQLNVCLTTTNLQELVVLASEQGAQELLTRAKLDQLRGAASFHGAISGAVQWPHIEGQLTGNDLVFAGSHWRQLQASLQLDPSRVQISNGVLAGDQGRMQIAGAIPLTDWKLDAAAAFSADVQIQQLSLAAIQQLASTTFPVQGVLNAEMHADGSLAQPRGTAHISLAQGVLYGEPVHTLDLDARGDAKTIHASGQVQSPAGAAKMEMTYEPASRRYEVNGEVRNLTPSQLQLTHNRLGGLQGAISGQFSGKGTLDDPSLKATLQSPSLEIRGEAVKNLQAQVTLQNQKAQFELTSLVVGNSIAAKGTVALTANYPATITIDTGSLNISALLQSYVSAATGVNGDLELHATATGPLKQPRLMQAHLEIPKLHLTGKDMTITNARPIRMDYAQGTLKILDAELKGPDSEFSASGSLPLQSAGPMDLSAQGHLDFKLLEGWVSGAIASGQAKLQLTVRGTREHPDVSGQVQVAGVAFSSDSLPVGIDSLNGSATLQGKRIRIDKLGGTVGGGEVTVGGTVDLGAQPVYALTVAAKSVRTHQNGVRAILDTDLNLSGNSGTAMLAGRVVVRRLSFEQGSDLDSIIAQMSGENTVSLPSPFEKKIKLNVSVQSDQELGLASSQLSVAGAANLQVIGTLADPVVLGRVALTGGEVFFLGKRFTLQSGTVFFANTARTNPILNLDVGTTVEQYNITIHLSGTLDKLQTTYTSEPALASSDIINLLAFGQTAAEQQARSSAAGSLGAESAIASAVGGQVAGQLQKIAGISQLTIDPLAGNSQNPGAQVAIQQRVTGNLLVTFSTDITSAQTQTVQLLYQVKPNVTVSLLRDENGGYGLDIRYHKVF